jgi:hypothetical protein
MDRCSECATLAYSHGLCRRHYSVAKRANALPSLQARRPATVPHAPRVTLIEPLLKCGRCRRAYRERDAYRATVGRWRDHLCGPCRHPLQDAAYVDPRTGAVLMPWTA